MTSLPEQGSTILIVEDEFAIREALTEFLEEEGYTVDGASNGQEALEYLESNPAPALILLDLRMPIMNGSQFLEIQRRDPALAAIPVVLLSADSSGQHEVESDMVAEYLDKPVRLTSVLDVVARYCSAEPSGSTRR